MFIKNEPTISLSIIIPVYNEENTVVSLVQKVLEEIKKLDDIIKGYEIITVDDGYTDKTKELILHNFSNSKLIKFFSYNKNKRKGAAIREGIKHIECSYSIIQDADMEYDPEDYRKLLKPIRRKKADAFYGSRFSGGETRVLYF